MWLDDEAKKWSEHVKTCEHCRKLQEAIESQPGGVNALCIRNLQTMANMALRDFPGEESKWFSDHIPATPEAFNLLPIAERCVVIKLSRIIADLLGGEWVDPPAEFDPPGSGKQYGVFQRPAAA